MSTRITYIYIYINIYVYAFGSEHISTGVCGHRSHICMYLHGCVCIVRSKE